MMVKDNLESSYPRSFLSVLTATIFTLNIPSIKIKTLHNNYVAAFSLLECFLLQFSNSAVLGMQC